MISRVYAIIGFDDSVLRYICARSAKDAVQKYLSVGGSLEKVAYVYRFCSVKSWFGGRL